MIFALCGGDGRQARLAGLLLADGHSAALLPLGGAAALEGFQRAMRMSGAAKGKTEE